MIIDGSYIRSGRAVSCKEGPIKRRYRKREPGDDRIYGIWSNMLRRCDNPNFPPYQYYGARGIRVCEEWGDFWAFRDWAVANGYADNLWIDRIDTNGDYAPANCRWATRAEQANNKRSNFRITIDGATMTVAQAARHYGVNHQTLYTRLYKGWPPERAVQPV